jgi:hypothetical protein
MLELGILGFVGKSAAFLVRKLGVEIAGGFFFLSSCLGLMGHPLQAGALMWSHQMTGL